MLTTAFTFGLQYETTQSTGFTVNSQHPPVNRYCNGVPVPCAWQTAYMNVDWSSSSITSEKRIVMAQGK